MNQHNLIHDSADEYGPIRVIDDGQYRILSFAEGDEQSRIRLASPHILQHEYTQAMMLPLLFIQPKRVCILGLGGGALVNALYHSVPSIQITAVELRQEVLDTAQMYFKLPQGKRINFVVDNAASFLDKGLDKKVDLLMTDIYHTEGMDRSVLATSFIENCARNIKENGWLVLNCWSDYKNHEGLSELLKDNFVDVRALDTGTGNWVVIACKKTHTVNAKAMKAMAQKIGTSLDIPLTKWLSRLAEIS